MSHDFEHSKSAGGWQISSPAILSSAPVEGSLKLILEAGLQKVREKSVTMTSYLMFLVDEMLSEPPRNFAIGTPREPQRRGGHVAIEHEEALRLTEALRARGVVPDYRPPNIVRTAPVPLYNTYHDIWMLVKHLKEIIDSKEYESFPKQRKVIS